MKDYCPDCKSEDFSEFTLPGDILLEELEEESIYRGMKDEWVKVEDGKKYQIRTCRSCNGLRNKWGRELKAAPVEKSSMIANFGGGGLPIVYAPRQAGIDEF